MRGGPWGAEVRGRHADGLIAEMRRRTHHARGRLAAIDTVKPWGTGNPQGEGVWLTG